MKMRAILGMACILLFAVPSVQAQNTGGAPSAHSILFSSPELDFFAQNMLGKDFTMPADAQRIRRLDDGKVEADFDRRIRYANLAVSPEGFSYNTLLTIKQTNYDLDANGNRILPGRVMDRTFVIRSKYGRSLSTGKIVGSWEMLYNDHPNAVFGMTGNMIMSMEEDKLVILSLPGGFLDGFAASGRFVPRTNQSRMEVAVRDGKVIQTTTSEMFDVDPETLERTPVGEKTTTVDVAEVGEGR